MDSKDKRLILAVLLAFALWGAIDFMYSPKPLVFVMSQEESDLYKPGSREVGLIPPIEEDVDLSVFVPEVEVRKVVRTVSERPYEPLFDEQDREALLSLVRREPVIEMSGAVEPSVLGREGGTVNISLRVKAYYKNVHNLRVEFTCPQGWEYIQGTTSNRFSGNKETMEVRLASLEDQVQANDGGVLAEYLGGASVEPTAELIGDPPAVVLNWGFESPLLVDQAIYLEFPLQTTGMHLPGPQEFVARATGFDRPEGDDPNALTLTVDLILRVEVLPEEEPLTEEALEFRRVQDWDALLLTSGINRGYREPLSGVGF